MDLKNNTFTSPRKRKKFQNLSCPILLTLFPPIAGGQHGSSTVTSNKKVQLLTWHLGSCDAGDTTYLRPIKIIIKIITLFSLTLNIFFLKCLKNS